MDSLMGYFSNGTEGDCYEARYCAHCRHGEAEDGCPVMLLHLLHNYEECNKPDSFLHVLIPRTKDGNAECAMFIAADASRCPETPDLFG
jgi:hypothetical protein